MQGFQLTKLFCMAAMLCVAKLLTSASPANIVKRYDDTHPLEAIVAQQARTIQELQAKMSAIEIKISTIDQQVAFTAYFSHGGSSNVGTNTPFKFDKAVVNIGQAYDPHTGMFTAPAGGLYSFFFNIEHDNQHGYIHVALEAAGKAICFASVNGGFVQKLPSRVCLRTEKYGVQPLRTDLPSATTVYGVGTCGATTHLEKGQKVWVRRDTGDSYINNYWFTSFSGVLVSADV